MNFAENDERVHLQRRDALRCQYLMSLSTDLDSRIPMKKKEPESSTDEWWNKNWTVLLNLSLKDK